MLTFFTPIILGSAACLALLASVDRKFTFILKANKKGILAQGVSPCYDEEIEIEVNIMQNYLPEVRETKNAILVCTEIVFYFLALVCVISFATKFFHDNRNDEITYTTSCIIEVLSFIHVSVLLYHVSNIYSKLYKIHGILFLKNQKLKEYENKSHI